MKTNVSKVLMAGSAALAAVCISACINPDYDLSQGIDTEVTLLPGKTLPVGDCTPLTLQDLIGDQTGNSNMQTDPDGNLYLKFSSAPVTQIVSIPEIVLEQAALQAENVIQMKPITIPGMVPPGMYLPSQEGFQIPVNEVTFNLDIDQNNIPADINSIEYAEISSNIRINFRYDNINVDHIYMKAGSRIIMPDYVVMDNIPAGLRLDPETNDLILEKEHAVSKGHGLDVSVDIKGMDFSRIPAKQGLVSPGRFVLNDVIALDMKIYTKSEDVTASGTFSPKIIITADLDAFSFKSIRGKIQPKTAITVDPVRISGLPEFLPSGTVVDLKGLRVNLEAENSFPIGGSFSATLQPVIGGVDGRPEEPCTPVTLGPLSVKKASEAGSSHVAVSLSEKGEGAPEGYENVKSEGLDQLVKKIPDQLRINNPEFKVDDEACTIKMGQNGKDQEYGISLGYEVIAPLSFGPDMAFSMNQDLSLALDITAAGINSINLDMIAVNTLPLNFEITAEVLGNDGQPSQEITVKGGGELKAGTMEQPVENFISLTLESAGPLVLDKVRLVMKTTGNAQNTIPLNTNQYLELKKLHLTFPNGITQSLSGNSQTANE